MQHRDRRKVFVFSIVDKQTPLLYEREEEFSQQCGWSFLSSEVSETRKVYLLRYRFLFIAQLKK